jgi:hypothetical protein
MLFHDSLNGVARALRCRHFFAGGVTPSTPGSFSAASQQQNRTIYDRTDGFDPAFEGDYYVITGRYQGAFEEVSGTTDIHATARLAAQFFGRFNNQDWLAESPWRGGLSRIACVHSFRAEQSAFNNDSSDDYEEIANKLFKQKRSARSAVILCALREEKVLRSPWVMGGVVALGHPRDSAEQYAVDASLPFLGQRVNSGTSVFTAGSKALAGLLTLDHYPNHEHAVLVVPAGGAVKLAIAYHVTQEKFFSVITAGYETLFASNATAFTPSPGWTRGSRSISVRFFSFATLAEEISAELAARNDAGGTGLVNKFNLLLGGVDNVTPSAMVASELPFDFGEKCVRSFYSTSIQRLISGDAAFEHPNYAFLNCENVLGLGAASARLGTQERVTNTEDRAYIAPNESLVYDRLSYVELKSSRHWMPQQPFDDEDVTFPIVKTQDQDSFIFSGTTITGTGLRFVPWASNTFTNPIQSYSPNNTLGQVPQDFSTTRQGSTLGQVGFTPPENESGTWFSSTQNGGFPFPFDSSIFEIPLGGMPDGSVYEAQDAGTPGNSSRRFYDLTATTLPTQNPSAFATYAPNASFDEQSYMTGVVITACPSSYSFGKLAENAQPQSSFGYTSNQLVDKHPVAWPGGGAQRAHIYIDGQRFAGEIVFSVGARVFMPSLAGKEFVCANDTVAGYACQAGLFHYLDAGESFSKTGTRHFAGQKIVQTYSNINFVPFSPTIGLNGSINYTVSFNGTMWTGKVEHACTFNTKTVELFIKWSAALQSPGPYKVTPPHEVNAAGLTYGRSPSLVAPAMWVKTEDVDAATPILVAEVWARAVGEVDVSSTYTFPEVFGTSGTYKHKVIAATAQTFANNSTPVSIDLDDAVIGHTRTFDKDALVSPQAMDMRYLGAFPFNRAQTQRLLDGETVTPTYWFLDDEGTALESQPVAVPWHNDTFGTYKLEFRLVTE